MTQCCVATHPFDKDANRDSSLLGTPAANMWGVNYELTAYVCSTYMLYLTSYYLQLGVYLAAPLCNTRGIVPNIIYICT